jgi:hypothetical protein
MSIAAAPTRAQFAAEHDTPIPYMQRTRDYYQALGFPAYQWAHFTEVPFTPLEVPLARARVGLITTAAPFQPEAGDQGPGAPYNAGAKFYQVYSVPTDSVPDLRISHVGYDRRTSTPTCRCRACARRWERAGSAAWPRGCTARPPTAATESRCRPTRSSSSAAAGRTRSTRRSWSRADRSATRP